jgi:beta-catenin-like protein 1
MENVFDFLCSALSEPENKKIFLDEEGVELMVIMMKSVRSSRWRLEGNFADVSCGARRDKMMARTRAIKVLDHALTGDAGSEACERFVEVLGLKSLFAAFMNKVR